MPFTGARLLDLRLQVERLASPSSPSSAASVAVVGSFFGDSKGLIGVEGSCRTCMSATEEWNVTRRAQRAGDGVQTHDNDVGNVVLYQLSYTRVNVNRYLVITYVIRPSRFPTICTIIGPVRCNPQISSLL